MEALKKVLAPSSASNRGTGKLDTVEFLHGNEANSSRSGNVPSVSICKIASKGAWKPHLKKAS